MLQLREGALVGPGEQIAAAITALADATGPRFEFVARSYFPAMPFSQQTELMARIAEDVAPHL